MELTGSQNGRCIGLQRKARFAPAIGTGARAAIAIHAVGAGQAEASKCLRAFEYELLPLAMPDMIPEVF